MLRIFEILFGRKRNAEKPPEEVQETHHEPVVSSAEEDRAAEPKPPVPHPASTAEVTNHASEPEPPVPHQAPAAEVTNQAEEAGKWPGRQRRRVQFQRRQVSSDIYIGLDFGTAFTKAAYEITPSNEHRKYSVKFSSEDSTDGFLFPSVLYYDADHARLMISQSTENTPKLEYFKLLMVNDTLQRNQILHSGQYPTVNDKEQLCSAFYLGYVFSLIRATIKNNPAARNVNTDSHWYVNMGIPIESDTEEKEIRIFRTVLNVAWAYSLENPFTDMADLFSLDAFFSEHREDLSESLNVYPELFAEVLLYQQDPNIPDGFYTVVDIGGGTADIATFRKYKPEGSDTKVECLRKNVVWLGYDSLAGRVNAAEEGVPTEEIKDLLNNGSIDFNDDTLAGLQRFYSVDTSKLRECRKGFRTAYGSCVMGTKEFRYDEMGMEAVRGKEMKFFPLGGAGSVAFYEQAISYMIDAQKNSDIPRAVKESIFHYLRGNNLFEEKSNRLLISQMLAQPYEQLPEIANMTWVAPEIRLSERGRSGVDLKARQDELYPK